MLNDELFHPGNCRVDTVPLLSKFDATVDVLRLDKIHPIISGNKWFKLKKYLEDAQGLRKNIVATFGGAYSNHIVATAAAGKISGVTTIGIIRGERPNEMSHTLTQSLDLGMKLYFISREDYKNKIIPEELFHEHHEDEIYWIDEGGYGKKGIEGSKTILDLVDPSNYSHIIGAVGTGTTLAGLIEASSPRQQIIGISVMKNNFGLKQAIEVLISTSKDQFELIHDYHFGGYAKQTKPLIDFINSLYEATGIPSDFVYTGKLFYAVNDLAEKNHFPKGSRLLVIHSGGLQGNLSLPKGTLIF